MLKLEPLPPKEAIAAFSGKGLEPSFGWEETWQEEHAKSFVVAKMMDLDNLEFTYNQVRRAVGGEASFAAIAQVLTDSWKDRGWWGVQEVTDPVTGKPRKVRLGSARRAMFILETNARVSHAAGRWNRLQANKRFAPYLMYVCRMDGRERPEHRAWHGVIKHIDDPWWDTHYPPCGWNCRCRVIALSESQMKARGLKVTENPPKFPPKPFFNRYTNETTINETGIDPGWAYNVGKSPLRALTARPAPPAASQAQPPHDVMAPKVNEFLTAVNAQRPRIVTDRDGWPVVLGRDLFRDVNGKVAVPRPDLIEKLPLVARTLIAPDKREWIWQGYGAEGTLYPDSPVNALAELAMRALDAGGGALQEILTFAPAARWLAQVAAGHGLPDLERFQHQATSSAVRHILDSHGNAAKEALRRQLAVVPNDLARIPEIVAKPDHLIFDTIVEHSRLPAIMYVKKMDVQIGGGWTGVYVEEIQRGNRKLVSQTLYKRGPAASDISSIVADLSPNVLNDGRNNPKVVDMAGRIKAPGELPRQRLVRRYSKRIDNSDVTVDFSQVIWTFDVRQVKPGK